MNNIVKLAQSRENEYKARKVITDYIRDVKQFEPEFKRLKMEGENLSDNQDYRNLKERKRRAIRVIFESMANVNVFLTNVANNDRLQEMFDGDLERQVLLSLSAFYFHSFVGPQGA